MFNSMFQRRDTKVEIDLDSGLGTCAPIYPFVFDCDGDQEMAELLKNHFNNELEKWKKKIAKDAIFILDPEDVSELKKQLIGDWDGRNHCFK